MQEEVENRTLTLVVSGTKFTGRLMKAAITKYLAHRKEKKLQKQRSRDAPVKPQGKQTVKQLIGQNQGVSNIEITDPSIKEFEKIARKYGVDYAVKKDRRDNIKPLSGIRTQVHTLWAVIGFQIAVLDDLPFMPPDFAILLVVPIHRILLVAFPSAGRKFYPFPVFVKVINLAALGKPFSMFVHCPHSEHDMGVGIVSRRMGVMDCKISNHAFGNKLLLTKLPDKDSILVGRYLSGDGKHPPPCKLGVPLLLHRFGGVP